MTVNEVKAVLEKYGYPADTYFRPTKWQQIVLDGGPVGMYDSWNLPIYYPTQDILSKIGISSGNRPSGFMLNFDHNNALLKCKYFYAPELVSTRFHTGKCKFTKQYIEVPVKNTLFGSKMEYPGRIFGSDGKPIRSPKAGDFVFTLDDKLQMDDYTDIAGIVYEGDKAKIMLTKGLNMNGKVVGYAFANRFMNASEMDPKDNSIMTYSEPVTLNAFDAVIDYTAIFGIIGK